MDSVRRGRTMVTKKWQKSYETGHALINGQHQELVQCVEDMAALMKDGKGEDAYACCLKLRKMMEDHATAKEKVLADAKFPRLDQHLEDHEKARAQLMEIFANCGEVCKKSTSSPCIQELSLNIFDHIIRSDMDYKSYLQTKNLADDTR